MFCKYKDGNEDKRYGFIPLCFIYVCLFIAGCTFARHKGSKSKTYGAPGLAESKAPQEGLFTRSADSYYMLACYHQGRGRHKEAVEEFKKAIMLAPGNAEAYNGIGISYDRLEDFPKAVESYQKALAADPNIHYIYNNLGYSYMLQGYYDRAIEAFKEAAALNRKNSRIHNNLGAAYAMMNEYDLAMDEFTLAGDKASAYLAMSRIYSKKGMVDEAEACYAESLKLAPFSAAGSEKGIGMPEAGGDAGEALPKKRGEREGASLKAGGVEVDLAGAPRKLGCIVPFSGPFSVYGKRMIKGVEMAVDEYNEGHDEPVKLVFCGDTEGRPENAWKYVEILAYEEKVAAIIGPLLTTTAMYAADAAEEIGIPLFTPTACGGEDLAGRGRFIFRNCLNNRNQVEALAYHAVGEMGLRRFAILSPFTVYGQEMTAIFDDQIAALGGTVEIIEFYKQEETDFKKQLFHINGLKPDALFIPDTYDKIILIAPQIPFYARDAEGAKWEPPQLLGTDGWYDERLISEGGAYVNGAIMSVGFYAESTDSGIRSFFSNFYARYGEPPDYVSAQSYDAAKILLKAIGDRDASSWDSIRERISRIQDFHGVSGRTTILFSGDSEKEVTLLQVKHGKFTPCHGDGFFDIDAVEAKSNT